MDPTKWKEEPIKLPLKPEPRHVNYIVRAAIKRQADGQYKVIFPDFPEASVLSPTLQHAEKFAKECVGIFINDLVKAKKDLPMPIDEKTFKSSFKFTSGYFRRFINVKLIESVAT